MLGSGLRTLERKSATFGDNEFAALIDHLHATAQPKLGILARDVPAAGGNDTTLQRSAPVVALEDDDAVGVIDGTSDTESEDEAVGSPVVSSRDARDVNVRFSTALGVSSEIDDISPHAATPDDYFPVGHVLSPAELERESSFVLEGANSGKMRSVKRKNPLFHSNSVLPIDYSSLNSSAELDHESTS